VSVEDTFVVINDKLVAFVLDGVGIALDTVGVGIALDTVGVGVALDAVGIALDTVAVGIALDTVGFGVGVALDEFVAFGIAFVALLAVGAFAFVEYTFVAFVECNLEFVVYTECIAVRMELILKVLYYSLASRLQDAKRPCI